MVCFLNRGFIVEQAIANLIEYYMESLNAENIYKNFHVSVTNDHPFAHMIIDNNYRSQDTFPCVVVTTHTDTKTPEMENMPVQTTCVGLNETDIDNITNIYETVIIGNKEKKRKIPGIVSIASDETINHLKEIARKRGCVYGFCQRTRRTDSLSIEIWADNIQLKNELYELLRLYLTSSLPLILQRKYKVFNPSIKDGSVRGERSNNFNFDFDVPLCGANLTVDVDYAVEQILIDTEAENFNKELIWEVINHVKV